MTRRGGAVGYLLLLPAAIWLGIFFVIPFYSLVATSLYDPSGSDVAGYEMTYHFANYADAISEYWVPLLRALWYGALATFFCLILGYLLAYAIAFKAGRWKNLMLVLVIAPFFTSFLVRTLSWQLILADDGWIVNTLQFVHILGEDGRLLATPFAVVAGLTYNFLPFMVLPLYASIDKIDPRLIEASSDLYANPCRRLLQGHLAAVAARGRLRDPADVHPRGGRLHQRCSCSAVPNQRMVGSVIQSLFTDANNYPAAGALSMILMIIILALVLVYVRRAGTEELL